MSTTATDDTLYEFHACESVYINAEPSEGPGVAPYVAVWGGGEALTPAQAREVAAALVEAAEIVEAAS